MSEPIGNTKQLPIRWMHINGVVIKVENPDDFDMRFFIPLYTHPMRELTDEEIMNEWYSECCPNGDLIKFARTLLKKASEK